MKEKNKIIFRNALIVYELEQLIRYNFDKQKLIDLETELGNNTYNLKQLKLGNFKQMSYNFEV